MKKNFNKLLLLTVGIALLVAIPLLHIVIYAFKTDLSLWMRLYETRLKVILPNTLKLLLVVAILINLFGISLAWVVSRYNFWGKGFWEWALVLPFAVPGYVMAYSYASFVAPGGPFQTLWLKLWGTTLSPPSIYNLWGVALILSFINYPYVYLLTRASFLTQSFLYEEVAKVLGVSPWMRFLKVNLRLAYPGIMAGTAMALMEVLADFGTVTLLRYPTFTEAIYRQMTGRFDPLGASALSLVLILIALGFLYLERHYRGRAKYEQLSGNFKSFEVKRLNLRGTLLVNSLLFIFLGLTFLLPLGILVSWAVKALWKGAFTFAFLHYVKNTIVVSLLGATLATVFALPVAYLHAREGGPLGRTLYYVSTLGYALPGPVVAVVLLVFSNNYLPFMYGTLSLLVMAYLIRFMPVAVIAQEASFQHLSPLLVDVSKSLGAGTLRIWWRILLPLIRSGLVAGWIIAFVDMMKELPATLMLRPLAYDTLAVRVWIEASESLWEMASVPALMIVLVSLLPVILLVRKTNDLCKSFC